MVGEVVVDEAERVREIDRTEWSGRSLPGPTEVELDGPLPIALYSAALFSLTEGRAYSAAEYRSWMEEAGLQPGEITPTLVHCGVLAGVKV